MQEIRSRIVIMQFSMLLTCLLGLRECRPAPKAQRETILNRCPSGRLHLPTRSHVIFIIPRIFNVLGAIFKPKCDKNKF